MFIYQERPFTNVIFTFFVNVRECCLFLSDSFTFTGDSITRVANQTRAIEGSISIGADRVSMAVVQVIFTLIGI